MGRDKPNKERDRVIAVLDGHGSEAVKEWIQGQGASFSVHVESISMDVWNPYIKTVRETFPNRAEVTEFDRFHVMKKFNEAVDKVRRKEQTEFYG